MKLTQFIKLELGTQWTANCIAEKTQGALSKRTANNWFNGDKRPLLELVIDGLKYRLAAEHNTQQSLNAYENDLI